MVAITTTEFDLSPAASREATEATYRKLLEEMFQAPSLVMVVHMTRSLFSRRVEFEEYRPSQLPSFSPQAKASLFVAAGAGERVAVVLGEADAVVLLHTFGYDRASLGAEEPQNIASKWLEYGSAVISRNSCMIVIGHDFSPLYLLQLRAERASQ